MPAIRPEVSRLTPYEAGRPIEDVAREFGFSPEDVVKLASNESPEPPFPEAVAAIAAEAASLSTVTRTTVGMSSPRRWALACG